MTRRREPTTLCWTLAEAAESLRVGENLFREWVKSGQVRVIRWNSLDLVPTVELNRLIDEALNGRVPTLAAPAISSPPPCESEMAGTGGADGSGELTRNTSAASKSRAGERGVSGKARTLAGPEITEGRPLARAALQDNAG